LTENVNKIYKLELSYRKGLFSPELDFIKGSVEWKVRQFVHARRSGAYLIKIWNLIIGKNTSFPFTYPTFFISVF